MSKQIRLNLTIPVQMDALLSRLADATGRSKASFALEALTFSLPHFRRTLLRWSGSVSSAAVPEAENPMAGRQTFEPAEPSSVVSLAGNPMTRQQRRALERAQRKAKS